MARIYQEGFEVPHINYSTGGYLSPINVNSTYDNYNYSMYATYLARADGIQTTDRGRVFTVGCANPNKSVGKVNSCISFNINPTKEFYFRSYISIHTLQGLSSIGYDCLSIYDTTGNTIFKIVVTKIDSSSYIYDFYKYDNAKIATTSQLITNIFNKIEIYLKSDTTSGNITVKLNNITLIELTNMNTSGTYGFANGFKIGIVNQVNTTMDTGIQCSIDDIAINDTTGTTNNSWCGSGTIKALIPTANGSLVEFTPNIGTNYSNVDDNGATDGDTTVNTSLVANQTDLFKYTSLSGLQNTAKINAISFTNYIDGQGFNIANVGKINGTTYELATATPIGGYEYKNTIVELNPSTSNKFTVAEINASEFGYRSK